MSRKRRGKNPAAIIIIIILERMELSNRIDIFCELSWIKDDRVEFYYATRCKKIAGAAVASTDASVAAAAATSMAVLTAAVDFSSIF